MRISNVVVAIISLSILIIPACVGNDVVGKDPSSINSLDRITRTKVVRVGYGGFPPYTIVAITDDSTQKATGYSVDLVKEIFKGISPEIKIEWVKIGWDTLKPDVESGKIDFIADPVYLTPQRALDFEFSNPYAYVGIAAAIVNINDTRIQSYYDLDDPTITIALAEGWTSSEYARATLSKPTLKSIIVSGDAFTQLDEVIAGRADVALNDIPTIIQYAEAHRGEVKALWVDKPPASVAGAFITRKGDLELIQFLNESIEILKANGTLMKLSEKWDIYNHIPLNNALPGSGISKYITN